jgi:hypothetical protein
VRGTRRAVNPQSKSQIRNDVSPASACAGVRADDPHDALAATILAVLADPPTLARTFMALNLLRAKKKRRIDL